MKLKFLFIALAIFFPLLTQAKLSSPEELEIVQLIELSRHGARAPYYNLWDYQTNWNLPLQTLTDIGQRQHYLIGQELRSRYGNKIFSGNSYNSSEVNVFSTSSQRAQQSALSQLYGIYQQSGENISPNWKFQASTDLPPMKVDNGKSKLEELNGRNLPNSYEPINVLFEQDTNILEASDNCHGDNALEALNFNTEVYNQFDSSLFSFKQQFVNQFNLNVDASSVTIKQMSNYWDSVICDIYQQIPVNLSQEFILQLNFVYDFQQLYLDFNSEGNKLLKLQTSPFFKNVIQVIQQQEQTSNKFQFYSASDNNLNSVLIALGYSSYTTDFDEWLHPTTTQSHSNAPFASTIFFEVFQPLDSSNSTKYVRTIFNDNIIHLNGCKSEFCNFTEEFIPILTESGILPDEEFSALCQGLNIQVLEDNGNANLTNTEDQAFKPHNFMRKMPTP